MRTKVFRAHSREDVEAKTADWLVRHPDLVVEVEAALFSDLPFPFKRWSLVIYIL